MDDSDTKKNNVSKGRRDRATCDEHLDYRDAKHRRISTNTEPYRPRRRGSWDGQKKARQFIVDVEETKKRILEQEDTDGDHQVTVHDVGPKVIKLGSLDSGGHTKYDIRGTYQISNLLQEVALAGDLGYRVIIVDEDRLSENPVDRLSRMIRESFWKGLVRKIDAEGLSLICKDPKNRTGKSGARIYVPFDDKEGLEYYIRVAARDTDLRLEVIRLPEHITPEYVKSTYDKPGILSLALRKNIDPVTGSVSISGVPFIVPGGRFNEMYGWDSYFETLGLLQDGYTQYCIDMVDNFVYQIKHYGKILNANRSYYLTRTQPPFLTDMALQVYRHLPSGMPEENKHWLAHAIRAAIKEYRGVWCSAPRLIPEIGLSRYHGEGIGMPPETEASHFNVILAPYAEKHGLDIITFSTLYNNGTISEPELDGYFVHDRSVRESGHDTTYRFEGKCANLATIDLNSLLYKYEMDIATCIRDQFNDTLVMPDGTSEKSSTWFDLAKLRQQRIDEYLWDEEKGMYFDYDIVAKQRAPYVSVTSFWALWAGHASEIQAKRMVDENLAKFEVAGGLVSGTEESRGNVGLSRPNRQWDYPYGWAPHQILAWEGLTKYKFGEIAERLSYRWLYMITQSFMDHNGVVPEKYDIVNKTHRVKVEYGNVGTDFKYVPREGFGWMNSSYQVGLTYLNHRSRKALGALMPPEKVFP